MHVIAPNEDEISMNAIATECMKIQHLSNSFNYSIITNQNNSVC